MGNKTMKHKNSQGRKNVSRGKKQKFFKTAEKVENSNEASNEGESNEQFQQAGRRKRL